MFYLKQSTASQAVIFGPFVDETDGKTAETGLTIANTDIRLSKNGGNMAAKNSGGGTHDEAGWYTATFDATDTNTVGRLQASVHVSGALPVWMEFQVVEEDVYEFFYASGASPDADVAAIVAGTVTNAQGADVATDVAAMIDGNNRVDVGSWLGTAVTSGTGGPDVNINAISDDTVAAANLELMFDGTGYTDDTAPASRSQVDGIGAASGGALNFANEGDNIDAALKSITFEGVETSGTNASVNSEDGTRHVIDDSSNNIDIVYQFDVGGGRTAVEVTWKGFLNGSNDVATLQAYNGTSFDTLFTIDGKNGSTNDTHVIPLLGTHTGTGSDLGKVFIRIECASQSNPTLNSDLLLVSAVSIGQTVGYQLGAVWIDTDDGVSGTESFVNGVADNPCLTLANAITIGSNVGLHRFVLTPESSITFGETHTNELWTGLGWTLALGNEDIGGSHFQGADVTGIGTGTAEVHFDHCELGACTLAEAHVDFCDISGTVTLSAAATYTFADCTHAGAGATIDFGSSVGNTTVHLHNYHGAITIKNMGQTGTDVLHWSSPDGKLTLDSTNTGGTVNMNGTFDLVNNGSGQTLNRGGDAINFISTRAKGIAKNTALSDLEFLMVKASDHVTPSTGLTVTGTRSIDGGAFNAVTGTIAEVANGVYQIDASAADLNGEIITFRFTGGASADIRYMTVKTSS